MFYRTTLSVIILCFCISCSNKKKTGKTFVATTDTSAIAHFIASGQLDSAIGNCNRQLSFLKTAGDSQYYLLNKWMTEKLIPGEETYRALSAYYRNIFLLDNPSITDTTIKKNMLNAYYQWASEIERRQFLRHDDSIFLILEKCITLNNELKQLSAPNEKQLYKQLGILYNELGDTRKSLSYYDLEGSFITPEKYKGFRAPLPDALAGNTTNRALALTEMGRVDSAINIARRVLNIQIPDTARKADLITTLSISQTEKKLYSEAWKNILTSLALLDRISSPKPGVFKVKSEALKQKGILQRLMGDLSSSVNTIKSAVQAWSQSDDALGRGIAKIYIESGKSYEAMADLESALSNYHKALSIVTSVDTADLLALPAADQLYPENAIMEALDAKATLFTKKFELTNDNKWLELTLRCYSLSFDVERKLMQNFSYDESRLIMLKLSKQRSERAIGICYTLKQNTGDQQWDQAAYVFAEKSKAFILLESIKRNIAANNLFLNDTLYQKVQSLHISLASTERSLTEAKHSGNDSLYQALLLKQKNTNSQLLLANNELIQSNTSFKLLLGKEDSISIPLIKNKLLDDHSALFECFAGDSSSYIFLITKNTAPVFIKCDSSFLQNSTRFLSFFTDKNKINNDPDAYQSAAYDLYKNTPIAAVASLTAGIEKLLIIPDGILNTVPFEALLTRVNKGASPVHFNYLVND